MKVQQVPTKPIEGQKAGTSGLRKKVSVFKEAPYLHNFVQSVFNALPVDSSNPTLVVGGDGRYFNAEALQIIFKIAAANGFRHVYTGQHGILSTPAVSAIIRHRQVSGALILTASHNPGGPNADFGIKYNTANGAPASESLMNAVFAASKVITSYKIADIHDVDLSKVGKVSFEDGFVVEVLDSTEDYVAMLKSIFDFERLRKLVSRHDFKMQLDSLHGVTGPYSHRIFVQELGAPKSAVRNAEPLQDFGGHHPDPNLTYAAELVHNMYNEDYDFGAAWDGDGDRNMVLGRRFFVNPSDSLAVIAAHAHTIPYFSHGLKAVARSMPTGAALDRVAKAKNFALFEVPTGWKFFGNIMDHYERQGGKAVICGEESFGTGSDHIREKDGIWAVLMWLSILAHYNLDAGKPLHSVEAIVKQHWATYGRNYFSRYDYEEVSSDGANNMMKHLKDLLPTLKGKKFKEGDQEFEVALADDFEYRDSFDRSVSSNQGIRVVFVDGSRLIFRLSGTGSSGATVRMYIEKYEPDTARHVIDAPDMLRPLIRVGLSLSQLEQFTGRNAPTVIT